MYFLKFSLYFCSVLMYLNCIAYENENFLLQFFNTFQKEKPFILDNDFYEDKMLHNVCAPIFPTVDVIASTSEMKTDPFSEFLAHTKDNATPPVKSLLLNFFFLNFRTFFCSDVSRI